MKTPWFPRQVLIAVGMTMVAALAVGGAKMGAAPELYQGKDVKDAAAALLQVAEPLSKDGSWELIAIGRVHYLGGDKQKGESFFARAVSKKAEESDWRRIAAVYVEAKDYDKAIDALEKALVKSPKESKILAELGAAYNLKGNRAKAEEMFARAFGNDPDSFWDIVNVAGSYLGVDPD